ncbi:GNAT family N-acetyltransferase [Zooshikella marina]|uniref:GNAT family N-acetyltransferase n=1 Tax=Zooshikella ganghwensis TaxID=202772 RepID=UPI001BB09868|nr:GNAT family N-acetyltransferase [Zooshikella ganghwensis]
MGKGIGKSLIETIENWARLSSVHRIELTVVESNSAVRNLYKKCGYVEEGIKRDSLKVDGEYVNKVYMSKLFETKLG